MRQWLPYWYAGLMGTASARASFERSIGNKCDPDEFFSERDSWPESWKRRFSTPHELRGFVDTRSQQALASIESMPLKPRTKLVSESFPFASGAFRTPFVQIAGNVGSFGTHEVRVAIVGTRKLPHRDAGRVREWLGNWLASAPAIIVSGGAYGVDSVAHEVALDAGLATWSVQAGGLASLSPSGNSSLFRRIIEAEGMILSERPPHVSPRKHDFLARNRIIAALADAVVVVRAPHRSGALNTAREANRAGIPVYAVPGSPGDASVEGTNALLDDFARVLASRDDWRSMIQRCADARMPVLPLGKEGQEMPAEAACAPVRRPVIRATNNTTMRAVNGRAKSASTGVSVPKSATEHRLKDLLGGSERNFDELIRNWSEDELGPLASALLQAELRGSVARLPGNQYRWS